LPPEAEDKPLVLLAFAPMRRRRADAPPPRRWRRRRADAPTSWA
jgi:hypothetical protein